MRLPLHRNDERREGPPRPLDRIVIGIDFTEVSLGVAQWVGRHLARTATLTLVHVAPPVVPNARRARLAERFLVPEDPWRSRIRSLNGALRGLAGIVGGARTEVEVRVGDPAVELAAAADDADADLIVVGRSGAFHAGPYLETSTTERLLRGADRPVLVAPSALAAPTTVLAAVAADGQASTVLAAARMIATPSAAHVAALRMADRGPVSSPASFAPRVRELGDPDRRYDAVAQRERVRMVLDVARAVRADIIAVGSTPSTNGAAGTASALVRSAPCAVLVVPCPAEPHTRRPRDAA